MVPEELTQVRMGKIVKEVYPHLAEEDQEAVRQHAIAALNTVQEAKRLLTEGGEASQNTALIDGVRKFAMDVTGLDIDLIDRINPFGEACAPFQARERQTTFAHRRRSVGKAHGGRRCLPATKSQGEQECLRTSPTKIWNCSGNSAPGRPSAASSEATPPRRLLLPLPLPEPCAHPRQRGSGRRAKNPVSRPRGLC